MVTWDLLRGNRHRLQGVAVIKGIVRYRHQGGGQRNARQTGGIYEKSEITVLLPDTILLLILFILP